MQAKIFKMSESSIDYKSLSECAEILTKGGIIAFPTETVYGLGAAMDNKKAMKRLYEIKKRPENKPFTIHISQFQKIDNFTPDDSIALYKLIDKFWPGPLTLILKAKKKNENIGLRCPANRVAQELISRCLKIIVATSANLAGNPPAIDPDDVLDSFQGCIDAIIDTGKTSLRQESSIVDLSQGSVNYLRIAAVEKEKIEKVLATKSVLFVCTGNSCRSVMAMALFEKKLKECGRQDIEVFEAGTSTLGGMPATPETIELLKREGIDKSKHVSTQLTRRMIRKSDFILVMTKMHQDQILSIEPDAKKRVHLLKDFAFGNNCQNCDIPDPIGQSMETYESCFKLIKQSIERLCDLL